MAETANGPGPAGKIQTERGLSESQQLTLNAVREYIDKHRIPPSFRDVMQMRELASTSTIQAHFKHLQAAGAIDVRDGVPRSVRVLWRRPKRGRGG
jgi:SOS-response transcriptional repressor LexA